MVRRSPRRSRYRAPTAAGGDGRSHRPTPCRAGASRWVREPPASLCRVSPSPSTAPGLRRPTTRRTWSRTWRRRWSARRTPPRSPSGKDDPRTRAGRTDIHAERRAGEGSAGRGHLQLRRRRQRGDGHCTPVGADEPHGEGRRGVRVRVRDNRGGEGKAEVRWLAEVQHDDAVVDEGVGVALEAQGLEGELALDGQGSLVAEAERPFVVDGGTPDPESIRGSPGQVDTGRPAHWNRASHCRHGDQREQSNQKVPLHCSPRRDCARHKASAWWSARTSSPGPSPRRKSDLERPYFA